MLICLIVLPFKAAIAQPEYTLIPDKQFEQVLIDKGIDSEATLDGRILTTDIASAVTISADDVEIADLTGIGMAVSLKSLLVYGNNLTSIEVNNSPQLATLNASNNQLQGSIDLVNLPNLVSVDLTGNPELLCIQVDDPVAAMSKVGIYAGWNVPKTAVFSKNCGVQFP